MPQMSIHPLKKLTLYCIRVSIVYFDLKWTVFAATFRKGGPRGGETHLEIRQQQKKAGYI